MLELSEWILEILDRLHISVWIHNGFTPFLEYASNIAAGDTRNGLHTVPMRGIELGLRRDERTLQSSQGYPPPTKFWNLLGKYAFLKILESVSLDDLSKYFIFI